MKPASGRASAGRTRQKDDRPSVRTGLSPDAIAHALIDNLHCLQAKPPQHATRNDWYMALAYTVRDRMLDRYITDRRRSLAAPDSDARSSRISQRSSSPGRISATA